MPLIFDPETHTYTLDGRRLPSVTQILVVGGAVDARWFDAWSRERGSAVHKACEYDDQQRLDYESLDSRIAGYLDAWRRAKRELDIELLTVEEQLHSTDYGFAGTLDRSALCRGKREKTVIDLKTGELDKAAGPQLAAYVHMKRVRNPETWKLRAIQLRADGTYQTKTYDFLEQWNVFLACLTLARWKGAIS
jgi:hypothetical protein